MSNDSLSRREFFRIATVASGGLILAGCAPAVVPTTAPTAAPAAGTKVAATPTTAAAAVVPQSGGILTSHIPEPPNYDFIAGTSSGPISLMAPCYNSLVMVDPMDPNKVIGDLAETWRTSADGKVVTFNLVKNATFHDGKPLTSADVKYTFDIVRNPPAGVTSARKGLLSSIGEIDTPDAYTVRFLLTRQSPSLISVLATPYFLVGPKHILQEKGTMKDVIVGSGPFMLKEHKRGVSMELVRNPNYHVKGRPYLDGLMYMIVPDFNTQLAAFRSGQLDWIMGLEGKNAKQVAQEFGTKVDIWRTAGLVADTYTLNSARKPFDDIRVRKAIALAVDKKEAIKVLMADDGSIGGLIPSDPWGVAAGELSTFPGYGKDMEANRAEAKKLLAEAGLSSGFTTKVTARKGVGTHEARTVLLKDQLAKVGINVTIDIQETAAYNDILAKRNIDIVTASISGQANDPDFYFADFHLCKGAQNYTGLCLAEVDEAYAKQTQTLDVGERKKLVNEMERAVINACGTIPLYFKNKVFATQKRVHGLIAHPETDNNRRMQHVWISK